MKGTIKILSLFFALFLALPLVFGCKDKDEIDDDPKYTELPPYDASKLSEYIDPFEYTGLTVERSGNATDSEAVWSTIVKSVNIKSYPEAQVEYYVEQERLKYKYFASKDKVDYNAFLESLGVTEETILADSKEMVKKDLALLYIVKDAELDLTEKEKSDLFDKYANKFVEIYGYDKEYISTNMKDQIYDSMLFDKATEYLILNNTIKQK